MSSDIDLLVSFVCEAKPKNIEGKHTTPAWLGRVPKEDVPAVLRFLQAQGVRTRAIYRDKSGQNRYAKGDTNTSGSHISKWVSGWAHKEHATHADIYEQPPGEFSSRDYVGGYNLMADSARLRQLKGALNGKKTNDPEILKMLASKPVWAYTYATKALKARWPEVEETIAKSNLKDQYLMRFPEAKREWTMRGWLDWLDP
jgi:hypothetical protein